MTNRTILIIGNEPHISLSIIKHYTNFNNKIIFMSNNSVLQHEVSERFPSTILLNLNFYEEADRFKLVEELNSRYLSPSCIIYNEFSYSEVKLQHSIEDIFQAKVESFYTSLTHLDECLLPFLETEADATVAYMFPKIFWLPFNHRKVLYILKETMHNYTRILSRSYPYIRFLVIKYPLSQSLLLPIEQHPNIAVKRDRKFFAQFKRLLENYHFPHN